MVCSSRSRWRTWRAGSWPYGCDSEAQAIALLDNLIDGLVRERAQAAALQLKLNFVSGFCLLPGLGLGLSFQLHPRDVIADG